MVLKLVTPSKSRHIHSVSVSEEVLPALDSFFRLRCRIPFSRQWPASAKFRLRPFSVVQYSTFQLEPYPHFQKRGCKQPPKQLPWYKMKGVEITPTSCSTCSWTSRVWKVVSRRILSARSSLLAYLSLRRLMSLRISVCHFIAILWLLRNVCSLKPVLTRNRKRVYTAA